MVNHATDPKQILSELKLADLLLTIHFHYEYQILIEQLWSLPDNKLLISNINEIYLQNGGVEIFE